MARARSSSSGGAGGIGGSGVFGLIGSTVQCKAEDTSFFCQLTKFTSMIIQILTLLAIAYFAYIFLAPYIVKGAKKMGRAGR